MLKPLLDQGPGVAVVTARLVVTSFSQDMARPLAFEDGAIAVDLTDWRLVAVGKRKDVLKAAGTGARIVSLEEEAMADAVIIPALVNAHCHMELSGARAFREEIQQGEGFAAWVRSVISLKDRLLQGAMDAAREAATEMYRYGIGAVGDHGNGPAAKKALTQASHWFMARLFHEVIHPVDGLPTVSLHHQEESGDGPAGQALLSGIAAHSVFLCSPKALVYLKGMCKTKGMPFSIHAAESQEELQFLVDRSGPLFRLMDERGRLPLSYELPRKRPIELLQELGLLDHETICVHCVHLTPGEVEVLARSQATACLCPRSNQFIGCGRADAETLFSSGVRIAIGTDSLASNHDLDIFAEMATLAESAPGIAPSKILRAATKGGAEALALPGYGGELVPGQKAYCVAVEGCPKNLDEVLEFLVKDAWHTSESRLPLWPGPTDWSGREETQAESSDGRGGATL